MASFGGFPVCLSGAPCQVREPVRDVSAGFVNYETCPKCGVEYILIDTKDSGEFWTPREDYDAGFGFVAVSKGR